MNRMKVRVVRDIFNKSKFCSIVYKSQPKCLKLMKALIWFSRIPGPHFWWTECRHKRTAVCQQLLQILRLWLNTSYDII